MIADGKCDGFVDCPNTNEEANCGRHLPEAFKNNVQVFLFLCSFMKHNMILNRRNNDKSYHSPNIQIGNGMFRDSLVMHRSYDSIERVGTGHETRYSQ